MKPSTIPTRIGVKNENIANKIAIIPNVNSQVQPGKSLIEIAVNKRITPENNTQIAKAMISVLWAIPGLNKIKIPAIREANPSNKIHLEIFQTLRSCKKEKISTNPFPPRSNPIKIVVVFSEAVGLKINQKPIAIIKIALINNKYLKMFFMFLTSLNLIFVTLLVYYKIVGNAV